MKNKQHNYTRAGVILFMVALPALGWAAQSLTEGTLALQAVTLKHAVPSMIQQAQQDPKPNGGVRNVYLVMVIYVKFALAC